MACTYTGSIEGDRLLAAEESRDKLSKIITELTQMFCGVMKHIEDEGCVPDLHDIYKAVPNTQNFWEAHKKIDAENTERDKKIALSKLTDYDCRLLGIKKP